MLLIAALLATAPACAQDSAPAAASSMTQDKPAPPADTVVVVDPAAAVPAVRLRHHHAKGDPLEGINRTLYGIHDKLDRAFFRPIAMLYKKVIPKLLRTAMRHIIANLNEPIVFMNDVLQLKPKRAVKTMARFIINSTVGVGGIADIAKTSGLPHHDNSLGDTLARYGVGPGPYIFIPFYGPTDLRDLFGGQVENVIYPLAIGSPFDRADYQISSGLVAGLDLRAESDADFKALLDGAADPYATLRSVYQQSRAAEIAEIKGEIGQPGLDDPLTDPGDAPGTTPPAKPAPDAGTSAVTPPIIDPATPPAASTAPAPTADPAPSAPAAADPAPKALTSHAL